MAKGVFAADERQTTKNSDKRQTTMQVTCSVSRIQDGTSSKEIQEITLVIKIGRTVWIRQRGGTLCLPSLDGDGRMVGTASERSQDEKIWAPGFWAEDAGVEFSNL
jgi:hypothetical protein